MSTPNDEDLRVVDDLWIPEVPPSCCEHGMPMRMGCDDCTIARLVVENTAQRELLRQAVEAMRDGLSVCNSVSTSKDRRVRRDGVTMYLQTEEWCDWLEKEVGPRIFDTATAINEHLDSNK